MNFCSTCKPKCAMFLAATAAEKMVCAFMLQAQTYCEMSGILWVNVKTCWNLGRLDMYRAAMLRLGAGRLRWVHSCRRAVPQRCRSFHWHTCTPSWIELWW